MFLIAASASADPAEISSSMTEAEQKLFDEGTRAARSNRWSEARDRLREAFALKKRPRLAALLGRVELELGDYRNAATHLALFLRAQGSIEPQDRQQAEEYLKSASSKIAVLKLAVDPNGAIVRVNGELVAAKEFAHRFYVDPGALAVEVIEADGKRSVLKLQAVMGATYELKLPSGGNDQTSGSASMSGGARTGLMVAGITTTVIGLGVGVGFTAAALNETNRYDARSYVEGSLAAFLVGGGVGVATALAGLLTKATPASGASVEATAWVYPGSGGVGMVGRF